MFFSFFKNITVLGLSEHMSEPAQLSVQGFEGVVELDAHWWQALCMFLFLELGEEGSADDESEGCREGEDGGVFVGEDGWDVLQEVTAGEGSYEGTYTY